VNIIKSVGRNAAITSVAGVMALASSNAQAFGFEWGDIEGSVNVLMSAGASFRASSVDYDIVSKRSGPDRLDEFGDVLCADSQTGGDSNIEATAIPLGIITVDEDLLGGCVLNAAEHQRFVDAQGSFTQNSDQGNLNYDKGDVVHAAFKTTVDLDMTWEDYGLFARVITFYDPTAVDFEETHIDSIQQPSKTPRSKAVEDDIGFSSRLEDFYVYGSWDVFDRTLSVNLGKQVVSWGESLTFVVNSINSANAPNVIRLNTPGLDLKELFTPTEMITAGIDLTDNVSMEAFYQLKWRPIIIPPIGDFFSTSDVAGTGQGYAMLAFGKEPEDPSNIQDDMPVFNAADPASVARYAEGCINPSSALYRTDHVAFGNAANPSSEVGDRLAEFGNYQAEREGDETAGRTICRAKDQTARDDGQFGVKFNYYAGWLNDTEFGFYYSRYHSRLPYASFIATDVNDTANGQASGDPADIALHTAISTLFSLGEQHNDQVGEGIEEDDADVLGALTRVDTAAVFLEYPEDIEMYGISFNTTLGDLSVSGEVAYRPNLPLQVSTVDATLFALSPAFGQAKDAAGPSYLEAYRHAPGLTGADKAAFDQAVADGASRYDAYWGLNNNRGPNGIYISNRTGANDTVGTSQIRAGSIIRGYERHKVANYSSTLLYATSTNPFAADQWIIIGDFGATQVFDLPELEELQYSAPGDDNWYGQGRAEIDAQLQANGGGACNETTNVLTNAVGIDGATPLNTAQGILGSILSGGATATLHTDCAIGLLRQTPVSEPGSTFATPFSWGFRVLSFLKYNNLIFGANLNQLFGVFVDVNGNSPGPGGNFVEGRKRFLWGSEFTRGDWTLNLKYNWFTGAADRNLENDRDNYSIDIKYSF
jgi:hypothetical protein